MSVSLTREFAALKFSTEICKLLMYELKDNNPKDENGGTPFHEAAKNGHVEICKLFMFTLKDKNPKDEGGNTPLHDAAFYGYIEI